MRWYVLQEGFMFVKQNLNEDQLEVTDIQEMINNEDKHLTDRIIRYGKRLCGSCQFWMARHYELIDIIKQIRHQRLIFFTFSTTDFYWPELHMLINKGECSDNKLDLIKEC